MTKVLFKYFNIAGLQLKIAVKICCINWVPGAVWGYFPRPNKLRTLGPFLVGVLELNVKSPKNGLQ